MPTDEPIACTLSAAELPTRLVEIRAVGDTALRSAEVDESRAVLRFAADPDVRDRLAAIVAAEARCCAFLELALEDAPGRVVLTMRAPEGAEPVSHVLVDAFRGSNSGLA